MTQLSLFDRSPPPRPKTRDIRFLRARLLSALRFLAHADRMPWSAAEARRWEEDFPRLAAELPDDEGAELVRYFTEELQRVKKAGQSTSRSVVREAPQLPASARGDPF